MPYAKRKSFRRKRAYRPKKSLAVLSRKVNRIARRTQGELKFCDVTNLGVSAYTLNGSQGLVPLNLIAGGTAYNQRTGNSVKAFSNLMRAHFTTTEPDNSTMVRCCLILDTQAHTASPIPSDVFQNTSAGIVSILTPINYLNGDRFKILWDRVWTIGPSSDVPSGSPGVTDTVIKSCYKKMSTNFRYNDATTSNFDTNGLYFWACCDNLSVPVVCYYYNRLRYSDN